MKTLFLLLVFSLGMIFFSEAQISLVPANIAKHLPDETAIVKDSTGKQYNYTLWTAMIASMKYSIRANGRKNPEDKYPEFLLYPLFGADGKRIVTAAMKQYKPAESDQFKSGDIFRPFKEKDINGEKFDLKKMVGKVFVINFWFIGCPPCRAEIPDLNQIVDHYKNNDNVVFIAICLNDAYEIREFVKSNPYNYHIIDNGRYLAEKYGVHLYPTNVVVNKEGKIVYSSISNQPTNLYWIQKTVDEALQRSPQQVLKQ